MAHSIASTAGAHPEDRFLQLVLRMEPERLPPRGGTVETEPIVQTVLATRPEFKDMGNNPVSAPMTRAGNRPYRIPLLDLPHPCLEYFPRGKGPALVRCPCAELGATRPLGEIGVRFFGRGPFPLSFAPDLPVDGLPPEEDGCPSAARDLASFAAFVIRVEDKPPPVEW